jgi:hypothetical protein
MTGAQYMSEKLWQLLGASNDAYWIMDGPDDVSREFYGAGLPRNCARSRSVWAVNPGDKMATETV